MAGPVAGIAEADVSDEDVHRHLGLEAWPTSDLPEEAVATAENEPVDDWAVTPGAWANAPAAPTYEPEEPVATVGGFVGADGFVYETKEQATRSRQHAREALAARKQPCAAGSKLGGPRRPAAASGC